MSTQSQTGLDHLFTTATPCRCGYDGTGRHRCHAGRNPLDPQGQCTADANPRMLSTRSSLAGMQLKTGALLACYCDPCFEEFRNL
jgi:hypothetical protein